MRNQMLALSGVVLLFFACLANAQAPGYSSRDDLNFNVVAGTPGQTARIAVGWGEQLQPPSQYPRAIINLRDAMTKWTSVPTTIENQCRIGASSLSKLNVLFITTDQPFLLSDTEKKKLKAFIAGGGLVVADDAGANLTNSPSGASLRQMIKDIGGSRLEPVPSDHAIFTTPFFLGGPPQGSDSEMAKVGEIRTESGPLDVMVNADNAPTLQGVFIKGRLAVLYSSKGYTSRWNDDSNDAQLKFGVNLIMYALENQQSR